MKHLVIITLFASSVALAQVSGNAVQNGAQTASNTAQFACDNLGSFVPFLCDVANATNQVATIVDENVTRISGFLSSGIESLTGTDLEQLASSLGLSDPVNFVQGFQQAVDAGPEALNAFMERYLNMRLEAARSGANTASSLEKAGIGMATLTAPGAAFTAGVDAEAALEDTARLERLAAQRQLSTMLETLEMDDSSRQLLEGVSGANGTAQKLRDAAKLTTSTRAAMQVMTDGIADLMVQEATSHDQQINYLKQLVATESYSAQQLAAIREELVAERGSVADAWRDAATEVAATADERSRMYQGLFGGMIAWLQQMRDLKPSSSSGSRQPGVDP
jgi:hypothetical protein